MDRKSIVLLVACFVLLMAWGPLVNKLYPPKPLPHLTNGVTNAEHRTNTGPTAPAATPATGVRGEPTLSANPNLTLPPTSAPEDLLLVVSDGARYTFTSRGGGLKQIELIRYPESVACNRKQSGAGTNFASLNADAPVPVMTVLGGDTVQGDGIFKLTQSQTATGAVVQAEKQLTGGLHLVKEFRFESNYVVAVTVTLENRTPQALTLPPQEWVIGTATPMDPEDRGLMMGMLWYNGVKAQDTTEAWFRKHPEPYSAGAGNVAWAAVHNQFFVLAAVPETNALQVVSRQIELPPPTPAELATYPKAVTRPFGFQTAFVYPELTLAPHQSLARRFTLYAGPKEYNTLARLGARMGNNLDAVMDFGFWSFFCKALLLSMNGLHAVGLAYGLAIIAITIIIKLIFWPLTQASTRSMKRMQALQPQMKALQEKFKDDPAKMNKKLMEFMKENKVSPLGGCLPMLLQIPVFFGFYRMLQTAIELRGQGFLWACDLSRADTVWQIPGLNFPVNPLPLIMGATMLWQARMTPPSPGVDPMQQKMMKYMPLMFMVFLYNMSAGLTLYWTVQNLLTIAQMKLTRNEPVAAAGAKPAGPAPDRRRKG